MRDVGTTRQPGEGSQTPSLNDNPPGPPARDVGRPEGGSAGAAAPSEARMNRIARRAHEIYDARGGADGKALNDWLQAEREVDAEMDAERAAAEP